MSSQVRDEQTLRRQLEALYAPVAGELALVEALLSEHLRSQQPFVNQLVRHSYHLGGKRMRPALVLLSGLACGGTGDEHRVLAAVVEMIHTATLVHDDVLDEADLRRHRETVNARWTNETSVLLGDYLFTHAFHLASTLETTYACRRIGESTNRVCEGELRQIESRGNYALSESEYVSIIDAKTAELCACCCRLGAHYSEASREVEESLARYGRNLGIAFQISDDLLDLLGDEGKTGKSLGTDLEKQKLTLPLIRALEVSSEEERADLLDSLHAGIDRPQLDHWFTRTGALDYARQKAAWYVSQALSALQPLPDNPATQTLQQMAEFVIEREA